MGRWTKRLENPLCLQACSDCKARPFAGKGITKALLTGESTDVSSLTARDYSVGEDGRKWHVTDKDGLRIGNIVTSNVAAVEVADAFESCEAPNTTKLLGVFSVKSCGALDSLAVTE